MQLRHICVILAVASVVGACGPKDNSHRDSAAVAATGDTGTVITPPPPPSPYDVTITFNCEGEDSVAIGIKPYRWTLPKNGKITWGLASANVNEVKLTTVNGAPWPFPGESEVVVKKGVAVQKIRGAGNSSAPELRYSVSGSCTRPSGKVDTIVIDPIMILPN